MRQLIGVKYGCAFEIYILIDIEINHIMDNKVLL